MDDRNGIDDALDVADGDQPDCNGNGLPDICDLEFGGSSDCDLDGIPDECQSDCNQNGRADSCGVEPPYVFVRLADRPLPAPARALARSDMNGDGLFDLLVAKGSHCCGSPGDPGSVWVLLNRGAAEFRPLGDFVTPGDPVLLETADMDGDGTPDLLVGNHEVACEREGVVSLHLNQGGGQPLSFQKRRRGKVRQHDRFWPRLPRSEQVR